MGDWKWIALAIAAFTIAVSAVGFWKYAHFRYQGLDLAIYTNVVWNLAYGNGWYSSIQANSYLGDHVEPILLFIAPLFRIWSDPRLLIILQALALGLTAVPVYLLLLRGGKLEIGNWKLIIPIFWLLNPLLWNAALFEFHALAFAPVLLLAAAVAYLRRRFWWFTAFAIAALLVREDIAFTVAMFGVVAMVDWWQHRDAHAASERVARDGEESASGWRGLGAPRRAQIASSMVGVISDRPCERFSVPATGPASAHGDRPRERHHWWWILTPIIFGIAWTLIASRIAMSANLAGSYKFLVYYGWLVLHSLGEGGLRSVGPLGVVRHLLSFGNFEMILGLLLPFAFLPLVRPKWLLLALPSFLALILAAPGGSAIVVMTHYALAFIPALVLASWEATVAWRDESHLAVREWLNRRLPSFPVRAAVPVAAIWALATMAMLGPLPGIARIIAYGPSADDTVRTTAYRELLARVPPDASIAASYAALPHVAARRGAYSMASAYLGTTQFAEAPYALPQDTAYLLMDTRDALAYAVQFPAIGWSAPYAKGGPDRLRALIRDRGFSILAERNGIALFHRDDAAAQSLDEHYVVPRVVPPRAYLGIDELRDVMVQSFK